MTLGKDCFSAQYRLRRPFTLSSLVFYELVVSSLNSHCVRFFQVYVVGNINYDNTCFLKRSEMILFSIFVVVFIFVDVLNLDLFMILGYLWFCFVWGVL